MQHQIVFNGQKYHIYRTSRTHHTIDNGKMNIDKQITKYIAIKSQESIKIKLEPRESAYIQMNRSQHKESWIQMNIYPIIYPLKIK